MGGYGSGARFNSRELTTAYVNLDVRTLSQSLPDSEGLWRSIKWSRGGSPRGDIRARVLGELLWLSYRTRRFGGEWRDREYSVTLERTPCHYGGSRLWFRCPAQSCGRRVRILYGGGYFLCRKCMGLSYASQREVERDRAAARADALIDRVRGHTGCLDSFPPRPKGMHSITYDRLRMRCLADQERMMRALATGMGMSMTDLGNDWLDDFSMFNL